MIIAALFAIVGQIEGVMTMFPHEAQELMAKILFFIFAVLILCFSKVNATELNPVVAQSVSIESQSL